jgi:AcrR family transcriptional regulator
MPKHSSVTSKEKSDSRQALLEAAKKVFAEKGFEGATVKDLADAAKVNVSLVSYYFGGKDGLYRECLVDFAEERVQTIVRILKPAQSRDEFKTRIMMFGEEMIEVHLREPELCCIIHRDIQMLTPAIVEIFRGGFFKIFMTLVTFLKQAEKNHLISEMKDPEVSTSLVFGSLMHILQSEPHRKILGRPSIQNKDYRNLALDQWTQFVISGLDQNRQTATP